MINPNNPQLKVAIVTQFPHDTNRPHGGVEAVSVNLTKALASFDDLDIHVVTQDPQSTTATTISWENATIHQLPKPEGNTLTNAVFDGRKQITTYLEELKPDLIHAHDTYGIMIKGIAIPRVFTIHGFIYGDTLLSGKRFSWLRSKIWQYVETNSWADQPHIISISPYVRERLAGITKSVIHDIDNPISETFFDVPRQEKKGSIFSAAVINPRKNTLMLIKAASSLIAQGHDIELRLAGPFVNNNYEQLIKKYVNENKLEDKVIFLGACSSDEVKKELAHASCFALVSLEENSPMGIEEAMAAGVPVITSNRCGMPYMVRHGESGFLVNQDDISDIAQRIKTLLNDDDLRSAMSEKSRAIALDRFHPDSVARRTRDVYLNL